MRSLSSSLANKNELSLLLAYGRLDRYIEKFACSLEEVQVKLLQGVIIAGRNASLFLE